MRPARIHGITSSSISDPASSSPRSRGRRAPCERRARAAGRRARTAGPMTQAERPVVGRGSCCQISSGQLEHRRARRRGEVEVLVDRRRRLHREADAVGQVAAVRVVADLACRSPRMWSGSWPLSTFWTRSGTTWLMASLTLPLMTSVSRNGAALADADAVERPHDRVGQPVLLPGALREVLARRASGSRRSRSGGGEVSWAPSGVGKTVVDLEHHRGARSTMIRSRSPLAVRLDRGVEGARPGCARSRRAGRRRTRGSS